MVAATALPSGCDPVMLPTMTSTATGDRRRHERQPGAGRYLEIAGRAAQLLDWSFSGLGARFVDAAPSLAAGASVTVRILRKDGKTWTDLDAVVRRIEPEGGIIGVELDGSGDESFGALLELLGHKLHESPPGA